MAYVLASLRAPPPPPQAPGHFFGYPQQGAD
jgi:hypothetical protein